MPLVPPRIRAASRQRPHRPASPSSWFVQSSSPSPTTASATGISVSFVSSPVAVRDVVSALPPASRALLCPLGELLVPFPSFPISIVYCYLYSSLYDCTYAMDVCRLVHELLLLLPLLHAGHTHTPSSISAQHEQLKAWVFLVVLAVFIRRTAPLSLCLISVSFVSSTCRVCLVRVLQIRLKRTVMFLLFIPGHSRSTHPAPAADHFSDAIHP
jgi:hypothetical protein